jgi:hypothetical protein
VSAWKRCWLRWAVKLIRKNFDVCEIATTSGTMRGIFITKDLLDNIAAKEAHRGKREG